MFELLYRLLCCQILETYANIYKWLSIRRKHPAKQKNPNKQNDHAEGQIFLNGER